MSEFRQAVIALEASALIAGLPMRAVRQYCWFAFAARATSDENFEEDPDPEYGGGIRADLADVVRAQANEVARLAWSPRRTRIRLASRLQARRHALLDIISDRVASNANHYEGPLPSDRNRTLLRLRSPRQG